MNFNSSLGFSIEPGLVPIFMAAYVLIALVLIVFLPAQIYPDGSDTDFDKLLDRRSKLRSTIMQVAGGIIVVLTAVSTLQGIRGSDDTYNQKRAELFATSVQQIFSTPIKERGDQRQQGIYLLDYLARSDKSYYSNAFDALSSFVVSTSRQACKPVNGVFNNSEYVADPTLTMAMRVIGQRTPAEDPSGKHLNLEGGCYIGIDMLDQTYRMKGLANARMSDAILLRVDFTKVDLHGVELMGITAGDYSNSGWQASDGFRLHNGVGKDKRVGGADGAFRRRFVAHFIDANLEGAKFGGAGLAGADFSGARLKGANFDGAVISRASFKGAQDLDAKMFANACVGRKDMKPEELEAEQPYFWNETRVQIKPCG